MLFSCSSLMLLIWIHHDPLGSFSEDSLATLRFCESVKQATASSRVRKKVTPAIDVSIWIQTTWGSLYVTFVSSLLCAICCICMMCLMSCACMMCYDVFVVGDPLIIAHHRNPHKSTSTTRLQNDFDLAHLEKHVLLCHHVVLKLTIVFHFQYTDLLLRFEEVLFDVYSLQMSKPEIGSVMSDDPKIQYVLWCNSLVKCSKFGRFERSLHCRSRREKP